MLTDSVVEEVLIEISSEHPVVYFLLFSPEQSCPYLAWADMSGSNFTLWR